MPVSADKIQVTAVISRRTYRRLEADAKQNARSLSSQIRYLLERHYAEQPGQDEDQDQDQEQ